MSTIINNGSAPATVNATAGSTTVVNTRKAIETLLRQRGLLDRARSILRSYATTTTNVSQNIF